VHLGHQRGRAAAVGRRIGRHSQPVGRRRSEPPLGRARRGQLVRGCLAVEDADAGRGQGIRGGGGLAREWVLRWAASGVDPPDLPRTVVRGQVVEPAVLDADPSQYDSFAARRRSPDHERSPDLSSTWPAGAAASATRSTARPRGRPHRLLATPSTGRHQPALQCGHDPGAEFGEVGCGIEFAGAFACGEVRRQGRTPTSGMRPRAWPVPRWTARPAGRPVHRSGNR
jgi:hypothetical protein